VKFSLLQQHRRRRLTRYTRDIRDNSGAQVEANRTFLNNLQATTNFDISKQGKRQSEIIIARRINYATRWLIEFKMRSAGLMVRFIGPS